MAEKDDSNYEIGYGRPPKRTRFKPGKSGNPAGRPRKRPTFNDEVETELNSTITVTEGGKQRRMSKRRAIAKQHTNLALGGDVKSAQLLLKMSSQDHFSQNDILDSVLYELRDRNRRIQANEPVEKSNGSSALDRKEKS
jgi:hypothetical protein